MIDGLAFGMSMQFNKPEETKTSFVDNNYFSLCAIFIPTPPTAKYIQCKEKVNNVKGNGEFHSEFREVKMYTHMMKTRFPFDLAEFTIEL